MCGIEIGRTDQEAGRDPIELDQGERRRELVGRGDEHVAPSKACKRTSETGSAKEVLERHRAGGA
jgi:hypothetical protein